MANAVNFPAIPVPAPSESLGGSLKIQFSGLSWWLNGEESACQFRRRGFDP